MGKRHFRWVGLLVSVAIVAGAATAYGDLSGDFSSPPAPVPGGSHQDIYLQLVGATPGTFKGGVTTKGYEGDIQVLALDLPSTGNGQSPCSSIEFRKPTDASTPSLFLSQRENETISRATFMEARTTSGRPPYVVLKITATNATLTSVHHVDSTTTGPYEDVTLAPTKMSIEYVPTKHTVLYTCNPSP
jgi:type VI protein secretion system component Hcp